MAAKLIQLAPALVVPHGLLAGKPPVLMPWMLDFVAGAFADGIREAALSVARKNAKSSLVALILLAHLASPPHPRWRCVVASETGKVAGELRDLLVQFLEASGIEAECRRSPPPGAVVVAGARVDFVASNKATGLAIGSDLAVVDEAGVLGEDKRVLWDSMLSSVSARDGRFVALGARYMGPMFAELLARKDDPAVHVTHYAADDDAALDDAEQWHKANPALDVVKPSSYMDDMARRALAVPASASGFAAHDLNLPREPELDPLVSPMLWRGCVVETLPPGEGVLCVGLDIGGASSLTAACLYWPTSMRFEALVGIPGIPAVAERESADGVAPGVYRRMVERGEAVVFRHHRATPVQDFLGIVAARCEGHELVAVGADLWKRGDVEDALAVLGIDWPMVWRSQARGKDAAADIVAFQHAVAGHSIRTVDSLAMSLAIRESRLQRDPNGNAWLDKRRQRGRIDCASAAVIALGLGKRFAHIGDPEVEIAIAG